MAEVLVPDSLPLAGHLEWILCRTQLDALSLVKLAGGRNKLLREHLRISTRPSKVFFCRGLYIEEAEIADGIMWFKIKPSLDYRSNMELKLRVRKYQDGRVQEREASRALTGKPFRLKGFDMKPGGHWRIDIEDAMAFCGELPERATSVYQSAS